LLRQQGGTVVTGVCLSVTEPGLRKKFESDFRKTLWDCGPQLRDESVKLGG